MPLFTCFHCGELFQSLKLCVASYWQSVPTIGVCVSVAVAGVLPTGVVRVPPPVVCVAGDDFGEGIGVEFVEAVGRNSSTISAMANMIVIPVLITAHKLRRKKLGLSLIFSSFEPGYHVSLCSLMRVLLHQK